MTHDISTGMVKFTYPGENLYLFKHRWWIAKGPRSRHWMAHVNCMQGSVEYTLFKPRRRISAGGRLKTALIQLHKMTVWFAWALIW